MKVCSVLQFLSVSSCCTVVESVGIVCMKFPWLLKMVCFIGLRFREVVVSGSEGCPGC